MTRGDAPVIMVTGANGQVGFELVRALQGLGRVVGLDRRACDLSDLRRVRDTVRALKPALIINAAAYTDVDRAESEPKLAFRVNGEAPGVMAEEARRLGAALIHYSTDYVFDGTKAGAYVEEDAPCPINEYGRGKLAGERAIQQSASRFLIFRTSWVYGRRRNNFLKTILSQANQKQDLRVVTDQIGAPTWCRAVAELTAQAVARAGTVFFPLHGCGGSGGFEPGIYNLTATGTVSRYQFAREIIVQAGLMDQVALRPVLSTGVTALAPRPRNCRLSNRKLREAFALYPADWREALRLCIDQSA